jgi:hypothetical protein
VSASSTGRTAHLASHLDYVRRTKKSSRLAAKINLASV